MPKPKVMDLQLSEPPPWKCPKVFKNQQQLCLAHSASCKRPNQAFLFEDFRLQNYADWLPLPGFFLQREAKLVTRFLNRKRKVLPKKVSSPLLSKRIKKSRRSQVEVKSSAKHIVHPPLVLCKTHRTKCTKTWDEYCKFENEDPRNTDYSCMFYILNFFNFKSLLWKLRY